MIQAACATRRPWDVEFTAHPEQVAGLRRLVRRLLADWGLRDLVDTAQLCVSELVSNVVTHVGLGTPGSLAVSMNGTHLRIEVRDPDTRALPTLVAADIDAEGGRGMALVEALTDRWGVQLREDRKVTWCELAIGPASPAGRAHDPSVTRAEALLDMYATLRAPVCSYDRESGRVGRQVEEESVIAIVTDLLHRLRARGCDVERVLDCAQIRLEGARRPLSP
ncbi:MULTISPECIES: ATP-binding protein [unclassified Streptomyces]|uniref:ATP-binding protein n=1 Tax=unclassified Streptomyces TaxID=2593676 RepID=UPI000F6C1443|nr:MULTISPECIES: ATP-binding protein [unclassified Streptomyces]AZM62046.1 ATP-binding protein [Streptomyces sp. WAC 01438]RSM97362.1 ATP-binding protein [Streptomyces sp. WAC 01420]